jgi:hypothetical protein
MIVRIRPPWLAGAVIPLIAVCYVWWVAANAGLALAMPACAWEMLPGDSVQLPGPYGESPYGELKLFQVHFDFRRHPRLFAWSIDSMATTGRGTGGPAPVVISRAGMLRAVTPGIATIKGDWPGPWRAGRPVFEQIYVLPAALRAIDLSADRDTIAVHDSVRIRYALRNDRGDTLNWLLRPAVEPHVDPDGPLYRKMWSRFAFEGVRAGVGTVEMCIGSRHASVPVVVR